MQEQTRRDQKRGLIVCAWCSKYIGTMKGAERVSHGICRECKTRELARWGVRSPVAGSHGAHQGGPSLMGASMGEGAGHP
jgi:hypothetical protein